MKRISSAIIAVALLGGNAVAADLGGYKDASPAPASIDPYQAPSTPSSWTGFTVGAHVGYMNSSHDITREETITTEGTSESCKDGHSLVDGKCYAIEVPAKPERCETPSKLKIKGWTGEVVLKDGKCLPVVGYVGDEPKTVPYDIPGSHQDAEDAVLSETASDDAYIPAVDGAAIVTRTLQSIDPNGIYGGVSLGADYQPEGSRLVFGVFGEFNIADANERNSTFGLEITDGNSYLIGGRLGLAFDSLLAYVHGGYALQDVTYDFDGRSVDKTFGHPFAGLGAEYKLSKNLSLDAKYMHLFESDETFYNVGGTVGKDSRSDDRFQVGFKYRFGLN